MILCFRFSHLQLHNHHKKVGVSHRFMSGSGDRGDSEVHHRESQRGEHASLVRHICFVPCSSKREEGKGDASFSKGKRRREEE